MVCPNVSEEFLEVRMVPGRGALRQEAEPSEDSVEILVGQEGLDHVGPVKAVHAVGPEHTLLLTVLRHTLKTKNNHKLTFKQ